MERRKFLLYTGKMLGIKVVLLMPGCNFIPLNEDDSVRLDEEASEDDLIREAMFYEQKENKKVECHLCFRECEIESDERGFCHNRENRERTLYNIVYGRPSAVQIDPVEKEPQHHFLPGSEILCVGTAGCNFRCRYCHNHHLSQQSIDELQYEKLPPEQLVEEAKNQQVSAISFTYNEPTSLYEYMYDTAKKAQEQGVKVIFHTNGSMKSQPLKKLLEYVDSVTVDLKGIEEEFYRDISQAELSPVLDTLQDIADSDAWLEIVNLVVTDLNDKPEQIEEMCSWIVKELGSDIPLHFTRFTPSYKMTDTVPTPVERLEDALEIALDQGIKFVTIGNVPGHEHNSTFCPHCGSILIGRDHFTVIENNLDDNKCQNCGEEIPGVWNKS